MAFLYQVPVNNALQYTLDSAYTAGGTSLVLNASVAGVVKAPGVCVVDRVDSSGNSTATKRTYYSFTGVSGVNLTGLATVDGTDQSHSVGAIVEFLPDVIQQQAIYDTFNVEHDSTNGYHKSLASLVNLQAINGVFTSLVSMSLLNTRNLVVASQASMALLDVGTRFSASGASLTGVFPSAASGQAYVSLGNGLVGSGALGGAGGFNALFQVPGGLASLANTGGLVPVPTSFTAQFMQLVVQTPASVASVSIVIKKNLNTIFGVGTILAGATFASTASISSPALVAGDVLTMDINSTASLATDLSVLLRAT